MSEDAKRLIDAIQDYMQVSMKADYVLSVEEQRKMEQYIKVLDRHIKMLVDYELKREDKADE